MWRLCVCTCLMWWASCARDCDWCWSLCISRLYRTMCCCCSSSLCVNFLVNGLLPVINPDAPLPSLDITSSLLAHSIFRYTSQNVCWQESKKARNNMKNLTGGYKICWNVPLTGSICSCDAKYLSYLVKHTYNPFTRCMISFKATARFIIA